MNSRTHQPFRIVVLISGSGTNLQSIIDNIAAGRIPATVAAVISNKSDAYGLERAARSGIPAEVLDHREFASREGFDRELMNRIDHYRPDLVVLAGFMRILSDAFVEHYAGRMINIHPSLLPRHRGLNTHQRAIEAGDTLHGASVHYVVPELDSGPLILQAQVPILERDTPDTLAERVHRVEHIIYPEVIRRIASGEVQLKEGTVFYKGRPILEDELLYAVDSSLAQSQSSN